MKDVVLVVTILVSVGLLVFVVRFNEKATKAGKSLEEERYSRMVVEESLQKTSSKVSTLEAQLASAQEKMVKVQDILDQEKNVNDDLRTQYDKLRQSKTDLESKLQATLQEQQAAARAAARRMR